MESEKDGIEKKVHRCGPRTGKGGLQFRGWEGREGIYTVRGENDPV